MLTFTGAPLGQPLTVMGRVSARLWVSSSAPDTDFVARLIDVHPNGYMQNVCDGILRARYRESPGEPRWLEPGQAYELNVDLWSGGPHLPGRTSAGPAGDEQQLPRWDRNWNSQEDRGRPPAGPAAEQTIWHSAAQPSCVVLPAIPASD